MSVSMVIVNRFFLLQIDTPLFLLWSQLVFGSVLLKSLCFCTYIPNFSCKDLLKFSPLIAINVIGLSLNTMCLFYLDAVVYQICRALVLPITTILTPILTSKFIGYKAYASCIIVFIGFMIGVYGEKIATMNVSYIGILFGILSSMTTSFQTFIIQRALKNYKAKGPFEVVYLSNSYSAILLTFLLVTEQKEIANLLNSQNNTLKFLKASFITGSFGILINIASFLQILITSPLSHTVSSSAKGIFQAFCSYYILKENITKYRLIGIIVTLIGSTLYSVFRIFSLRTNQDGKNEESSKKLSKI